MLKSTTTVRLLELAYKVESTSTERFIHNHRVRLIRCLEEEINNFLMDFSDGPGRCRDKVNLSANIIYGDSLHILEWHPLRKIRVMVPCNFNKKVRLLIFFFTLSCLLTRVPSQSNYNKIELQKKICNKGCNPSHLSVMIMLYDQEFGGVCL